MKTKNLSLQEAIKSGQAFRRSVFPKEFWYEARHNIIRRSDGYTYQLDVCDIMATDWEIKSEPMVIYVNEYRDGKLEAFKDRACARWIRVGVDCVTRKFVEVIE